MNNADNTPTGTYTPGYARQKMLMVLFGLLLFAAGLWQLASPVRLLLFGARAEAEATDVVKTKTGLPDLVLHSDVEIQNGAEVQDRSYVFWNDFAFQTAQGQVVTVRATVGSHLNPLYPLIDADGLPTTELVCYDPRHPRLVIFPRIISTWFAPGMMVFIGLLATLIGATLFYWADKPIVLPHIPSATPPTTAPPAEYD